MTKLETFILTTFIVLFICLTAATYQALATVEPTLMKILK